MLRAVKPGLVGVAITSPAARALSAAGAGASTGAAPRP